MTRSDVNVKKIILPLLLAAAAAGAIPMMDLGSEAFYEETTDTALTIDCPTDGVLMVGARILTDEGGTGYWWLKVDSEKLVQSIASWGTYAISINAGQHRVRISENSIPIDPTWDIHLWAIFWAEDTGGGAVCEQPEVPDESFPARVCRAGDVIEVISPYASVYDASGRLVERPGAFWLPTTPGTYWLADEEIQKVVVVE